MTTAIQWPKRGTIREFLLILLVNAAVKYVGKVNMQTGIMQQSKKVHNTSVRRNDLFPRGHDDAATTLSKQKSQEVTKLTWNFFAWFAIYTVGTLGA